MLFRIWFTLRNDTTHNVIKIIHGNVFVKLERGASIAAFDLNTISIQSGEKNLLPKKSDR